MLERALRVILEFGLLKRESMGVAHTFLMIILLPIQGSVEQEHDLLDNFPPQK